MNDAQRPGPPLVDTILAALGFAPRSSTGRLAQMLQGHEYLGQLSFSARYDEIERTLRTMRNAQLVQRSGLLRRWVLDRRGAQRLESPPRPCCGMRTPFCGCSERL